MFRRSAEKGYSGAQDNLGAAYRAGSGVAQDYAEALKWFHAAADQADAVGQFNLGGMYELGDGVFLSLPRKRRSGICWRPIREIPRRN